jgi:RNA polymerase sigma factor (sigma-70 family)
VIAMLHHHPDFLASAQADRLATPAGRRLAADPEELEILVRRASCGDPRAWSAIHGRFAARVRAIARLQRLTPHDVEDVVQTTWLRLLEHIDAIRDPSGLGAWLETTTRRESWRLLRAGHRERPTDMELLPDEPVPAVAEEQLVEAERREALEVARRHLPPRQQELLSMLLSEPAPSYAAISRTLGMPIGSIGPTRARCLTRLRRHLDAALANVG